jgi:hypothetical protein
MRRFAAILLIVLLLPTGLRAAGAGFDSDGDGLSDEDETNFYGTSALMSDTDHDGYADGVEIWGGYNPSGIGTLAQADTDRDGVSDADEILFGTKLHVTDSDGDGFSDGVEVANQYDPGSSDPKRLKKRIEVSLKTQKLTYYLGPKPMGSFPVSTGRPGHPTPVGTFAVNNKVPRAWSRTAKLWMPWWMSFVGGTYGLHELPEWPGGMKEGENHLGTPVSGGCVRLGVGPAKTLYDWAEVGTEVVVKKQ